jgi:hypothetical protein
VITSTPDRRLVSVGTVTAQLLYEIGPAAYPGPDVTARVRHLPARAGRRAPGRDHRHAGSPPPEDAEGGAHRGGRVPEHHDVRADRAGRRGKAAHTEALLFVPAGRRDRSPGSTCGCCAPDRADAPTNEQAVAHLR